MEGGGQSSGQANIESKPEESDVRREEIVESLKCWKTGLSDKPITWEFLIVGDYQGTAISTTRVGTERKDY